MRWTLALEDLQRGRPDVDGFLLFPLREPELPQHDAGDRRAPARRAVAGAYRRDALFNQRLRPGGLAGIKEERPAPT